MLDKELEYTLNIAFKEARNKRHEFVTVEHLLLALLDNGSALDIADARSICEKLAIDLQIVNFADEYWQNVFSYFLQSYSKALTPNPDVLCNKEIKFKVFLEYAKKKGSRLHRDRSLCPYLNL